MCIRDRDEAATSESEGGGGTLSTMWQSGFLGESRYKAHEEEIDAFQDCKPWGIICGMHLSEEHALQALERGEIEQVDNTSGKGPAIMYRTQQHAGVQGPWEL
eukprot:13113842-Alexandrium_andersonii.AAC.1